MIYDHIIIGTGPTGLTIAWILSQYNKRILLIDREESIGGCHRVRRVDGFFTEHGPRIYSSAYRNSIMLLNDMELDFYKIFTPYKFNISAIGGKTLFDMKLNEIFWFVFEFLRLTISPLYSKGISVMDFMEKHNFSDPTIDYIDRLCRLTEGAGSDKFTLFELLQGLNQHFFYEIYQPTLPNDIGLFHKMKQALIKTKNVDFLLGTDILKLNEKDNKITSITGIKNDKKIQINGKNFIFATPSFNLLSALNNSSPNIKNSFGDYNSLSAWNKRNSYNVYIPIVFHWDKKIKLDNIWGFPKSPWGVVFIVLTDYMKFQNEQSKTVISTCITIMDKSSPHIGKKPDECTEDELIAESFRQLKLSFPNLPKPTKSILSPGIYKQNNKWFTKDDAYVRTVDAVKGYPIPFKSPKFSNLFSVGPHSGKSLYHFTSFESAVTNGIVFCHQIISESKTKYALKAPYSLTQLYLI